MLYTIELNKTEVKDLVHVVGKMSKDAIRPVSSKSRRSCF